MVKAIIDGEVRRVLKIGNSFCISIPKKFLTPLNLLQKDYVIIILSDNKIIIKRLYNN